MITHSTATHFQQPTGHRLLDDRSRLCCHAQWYLDETAETLVHGLSQAIQKRRRPQQLLTDNGAAMTADEVREGLARLGILHQRTLPACPEQNGKQEAWWNSVEGRLLAMLENVPRLTLDVLNHATQAWIEMEYNRARHSEIGEPPAEVRMSAVRARAPRSCGWRSASRRRGCSGGAMGP